MLTGQSVRPEQVTGVRGPRGGGGGPSARKGTDLYGGAEVNKP